MPDPSAPPPAPLAAISVAAALTGDAAALDILARAIDDACRATGFFGIVDHPPAAAQRKAALSAGERFFGLPAAVKDRYRVATEPGVQRGYAGLGAEAQAAAVGDATPPDLSETFSIAPLRAPEPADRWSVPDSWPDDVLADLRPALTAYRSTMDALGRVLLRACALALHDDALAFDHLLTRPLGGLRVNHYPALDDPPAPGQWRGGAHTDYGTLTVLATDGTAGLEIQVGGEWMPVAAPTDGFLVNVGDILAALSGGRWPSTWHRVAVPATEGPTPQRTSLAFFQYPNADAVIQGLAGRDLRAGEYLEEQVGRIIAAGASRY
jgi:isopenicillin N synthase-like dioxygenase